MCLCVRELESRVGSGQGVDCFGKRLHLAFGLIGEDPHMFGQHCHLTSIWMFCHLQPTPKPETISTLVFNQKSWHQETTDGGVCLCVPKRRSDPQIDT